MSMWADWWRVCRGWPAFKACIKAQRQAKHALVHSLRVRLIAMFVLLALAMATTFMFGMQAALSIGWWPTTSTNWPLRLATRPTLSALAPSPGACP